MFLLTFFGTLIGALIHEMAGKDVVVTGATGLLGRQVARAFDRKSWNVKGTGYSRADNVSVFKVDLGSPAGVEKFLEESK